MNTTETICAISTCPGVGAVAMIRLSGPEAFNIGNKCLFFASNKKDLKTFAANTIHFGRVVEDQKIVDEVLVSVFKSPHSYTGEDTLEITCHGSLYIQNKILEVLLKSGATMARPGEFTQRAFLNGKLDLSQAEGVADLIASDSAASHKLALTHMRGGFSEELSKLRAQLLSYISLIELELDFSEEDVEFADREQLFQLTDKIERTLRGLKKSFSYGNAIKKGIPVAIVGRTNAGKSTLLNQLLKEEKAIVSDIAGTTRDYIEDTIVLDGINFRFIDTAGLRKTTDTIETLGIERSVKKYNEAEIVIVLIDAEDKFEEVKDSLEVFKDSDVSAKHLLFVINKIDTIINPDTMIADYRKRLKLEGDYIGISAKEGTNLATLEKKLVDIANSGKPAGTNVILTNARHFEAISKSHEAIIRVIEGMDNKLQSDLLALDIREVLHYLGEITGEFTNDEILGNIFQNFCIGK